MGYMTNGLSFNTLRDANKKRMQEAFSSCQTWGRSQWLQAIVGELGEFANILKKIDRGDFTVSHAEADLAKELADIVTYIDIMAETLGIDLGDAIRDKFNEVSDRVGSKILIDVDDWYYRREEK